MDRSPFYKQIEASKLEKMVFKPKGPWNEFFMTGGERARTIGPLVAVAAAPLFGLKDFYPVMLALVQENARHSPAIANGLFLMVSFLARSAVVVTAGFIADRIGLNAAYLISAALGLIGIPFV